MHDSIRLIGLTVALRLKKQAYLGRHTAKQLPTSTSAFTAQIFGLKQCAFSWVITVTVQTFFLLGKIHPNTSFSIIIRALSHLNPRCTVNTRVSIPMYMILLHKYKCKFHYVDLCSHQVYLILLHKYPFHCINFRSHQVQLILLIHKYPFRSINLCSHQVYLISIPLCFPLFTQPVDTVNSQVSIPLCKYCGVNSVENEFPTTTNEVFLLRVALVLSVKFHHNFLPSTDQILTASTQNGMCVCVLSFAIHIRLQC